MKYSAQKYFEYLQQATGNRRHKWYKRTVDYAKDLKDIICAEEQSKKNLLKQYNRRETDDEFTRSLDFTELMTRAMSEKIFAPVNKGAKNDQIKPVIKWKGDNKGENTLKNIESFFAERSLYQFAVDQVLSVVRYDPNAFILFQFKEFNANVEKPRTEAVIIPSSGAVDYSYENGELDYLIVHSEKYSHYTLYLPGINIRLTEVSDKDVSVNLIEAKIQDGSFADLDVLNSSQATHLKIDGRIYRYEFTDQVGSKVVQAIRIGHLLDPWTDGETCVSLLHPAIPRIKRTLQKSRNLSLSLDLHTFPQKIQVRRPCSGEENEPCHDGKNSIGETCKRCEGDGFEPIHRGPIDIIEIPLKTSKDEQISLDNVMKYLQPETESTKLLMEFETENIKESFNDVYTSNAFSTVSAARTATEVSTNYDSIHDKVRPEFAVGLRNFYRFAVNMIATFSDEDGQLESVDLEVPADLELYTLQELIAQYKAAKDASAPIQVLKKLREQILKSLHQDDSMQMKRDAVMIVHEPFADKTKEEVQFGASNGWIRKKDVVLFMNYDIIMKNVFDKYADKFFEMDYTNQKKAIDEQVTVLQNEIAAESSPTLNIQ